MPFKWFFKVLILIVLILFACVLSVICVNGIFRCYHSLKSMWAADKNPSDEFLYVDLYAPTLESIPKNAGPGMTVLIDLGIQNLDTGIYVLQHEQPPLKLKVPEVNEKYIIVNGEFSGYVHTIRPSFLEVKSPSETVLVEEDFTLDISVKKIIISHLTKKSVIIEIGQVANKYRVLKVANLSNQECILHHANTVCHLKPFFIGDVYISSSQIFF